MRWELMKNLITKNRWEWTPGRDSNSITMLYPLLISGWLLAVWIYFSYTSREWSFMDKLICFRHKVFLVHTTSYNKLHCCILFSRKCSFIPVHSAQKWSTLTHRPCITFHNNGKLVGKVNMEEKQVILKVFFSLNPPPFPLSLIHISEPTRPY